MREDLELDTMDMDSLLSLKNQIDERISRINYSIHEKLIADLDSGKISIFQAYDKFCDLELEHKGWICHQRPIDLTHLWGGKLLEKYRTYSYCDWPFLDHLYDEERKYENLIEELKEETQYQHLSDEVLVEMIEQTIEFIIREGITSFDMDW